MSKQEELYGDIAELLDQVGRYSAEYTGTLGERRVFPGEEAIRGLAELDRPLPEDSASATDVLELLHRVGSPATVAQTGGRYFGFVNGAVLPAGLAARWLADVWDQNTAHEVMSPIGCRLEEICERWLVELFGFPEGTAAGFVTGTMMANFSAMAAARNELLGRFDWDVAARGLYGAPQLNVVLGAGAHAAVRKALSLLGMGRENVKVVPTDDAGRMRADRLPPLDDRTLVLTQAGNVNSGAFDPVGEICEQARAAGAWVHVDGAFGLWAGASRSKRDLFAGTEKADSWAVDAHKTLNAPYDSGIVLCRSRSALLGAFEATASYFQWSERRDPMAYTPSMSKRARAVELWAILAALGRRGVEQLVDQLCARAVELAERLAGEGFEIRNDVVFNQVLVACPSDSETEATLEQLQDSGECWCGGSTWLGRSVIRVSVCSWATTREDIARTSDAFVAARARARERV